MGIAAGGSRRRRPVLRPPRPLNSHPPAGLRPDPEWGAGLAAAKDYLELGRLSCSSIPLAMTVLMLVFNAWATGCATSSIRDPLTRIRARLRFSPPKCVRHLIARPLTQLFVVAMLLAGGHRRWSLLVVAIS
ncbi:MAG: hypothetical protein M3O70_04650 [Actinomycetota bacterium]|nr:hypothetical protein [Actinomycetota bacterium]